MKCPNCETNITDERKLHAVGDPENSDVPWYRLTPAKKVTCPACGTPLRHNRLTLTIAMAIGLGFLATLSMKAVYPDSTSLKVLVWTFTLAGIVSVPVLMRSRRYFRRNGTSRTG